jgi:vitamin K-dependent gamma-carboxylase
VVPSYKKPLLIGFSIWFIIQIGLPVRHHFFEDNVLWTEEGHRLSWRMMLRSKGGDSIYKVVEKGTTDTIYIDKSQYLSKKQQRAINSKPDMLWQFAQRLKREYAAEGKDVQVFVDAVVRVNGRPPQQLTDPKVDLAAEKWHHFKHHDWILPSNLD